jgi:hypothetical protein
MFAVQCTRRLYGPEQVTALVDEGIEELQCVRTETIPD